MFEALAALVRQQWDNQVFVGGLALGALGAVAALLGRLAWTSCRMVGSRLRSTLISSTRSMKRSSAWVLTTGSASAALHERWRSKACLALCS